jgi:hypothetical protein
LIAGYYRVFVNNLSIATGLFSFGMIYYILNHPKKIYLINQSILKPPMSDKSIQTEPNPNPNIEPNQDIQPNPNIEPKQNLDKDIQTDPNIQTDDNYFSIQITDIDDTIKEWSIV